MFIAILATCIVLATMIETPVRISLQRLFIRIIGGNERALTS